MTAAGLVSKVEQVIGPWMFEVTGPHDDHTVAVTIENGVDVNKVSGLLQHAGLVVQTSGLRDDLRWVLRVSEPVEAALSESEAYDREHAEMIRAERTVAHDHIARMMSAAAAVKKSLTTLGDGGPGSGTLFDVEFDGMPSHVATLALDQIAVALAALTAAVPDPDL